MIEFILAILSFISSFIPYFGFVIAIILAIVSIILCKKKIKNDNKREKDEIYIISIVVSIISVILSIIIGIFTLINYKNSVSSNNMFSNSVIDTYEDYSINQDINVDNKLEIKLNSINKVENKYIANVTFKALQENVRVSTYDVFIYDEENNKTYFPSYNEDFISVDIEKDTSVTRDISFEINDDLGKSFLVYRYDLYGVKIQI